MEGHQSSQDSNSSVDGTFINWLMDPRDNEWTNWPESNDSDVTPMSSLGSNRQSVSNYIYNHRGRILAAAVAEGDHDQLQTGGGVNINRAISEVEASNLENEGGMDTESASDEEEIQADNQNIANSERRSFDDFRPSDFYHLGEPTIQRVRRFGTEGQARQFYLQNLDSCPNLYEFMPEIFNHALRQITENLDPNSQVGAVYTHPDLGEPIYVHFRPVNDMTGQAICDQFEHVLQSNKDMNIEDPNASIRIVIVTPPSGTGYHDKNRFTLHDDFLNRGHGGCFIHIKNKDDSLCLARAIVVGRAMHHKQDPAYRWNTIRLGDNKRCSFQKLEALRLMEQAGLKNHTGACGIHEMQKIQEALPDYKIKVFSKNALCSIIFEGKVTAEKVIHIYHHNEHFTVISSMAAFFSRSYWCEDCNMAYNNDIDHRCINKCSSCYHRPACKEENVIQCGLCNRFFRNKKCYENHARSYRSEKSRLKGSENESGPSVNKKPKLNNSEILITIENEEGYSICDRIQRCKDCKKHIRRAHTSKHKCGYFECRTCRKEVLYDGHLCYMQPEQEEEEELDEGDCISEPEGNAADDDDMLESEAAVEKVQILKKKKNKRVRDKQEFIPRFVFFDFETTQEKVISENQLGLELEHVPNLCITQTICDACNDRDFEMECGICGPRKRVFRGATCISDFCRYLFSKKMAHTTAIAHNAKGFDAHFILQYLYNEGIAPKAVTKGLQIIALSVGSVKIIDSLSFLPMPLAALPKAFNIEEISKGYFPHLFNRKENWGYIGSWPDAFYYSPATMKPAAYEEFMKWYHNQSGKIFNFQKELETYCASDVDVLAKACMKFRELFITETTVDPFEKSLTIAGACNRVFRKLFLKPETIGIIPHNGYRGKDKQSAKAYLWMKWVSETENIEIQHGLNGKEVRIGSYKVDGKAGNIIYEFYGCYWHGCPRCIRKRNRLTADNYTTARDAYMRTMERKSYIERAGYKMIEMWECELDKMVKSCPEMKLFFERTPLLEPLNPRDAFYGGRTNAIKLHHKVQSGEEIRYVDVCSLYPYTNKYGIYPLGHPKIITENFEEITKDNRPYEGLMKCIILPPQNLFHPVLPYRVNGKLLFPLCGLCADDQNTNAMCDHVDPLERTLWGTWVTTEVYKALDMGYEIIRILEVWHYEKTARYDAISGDGGLFNEYVNSFMKLKLEAEGWPQECNDEGKRKAYLDEIYEREKIILDSGKIAKNPGKRALAKLMLNSFWGKVSKTLNFENIETRGYFFQFGQRNNLVKTEYFTEPQLYFSLVFDASTVVHSITIINDYLVSVTYSQQDAFTDVLPYTNPVIAAYTTAQARLTLYSYIEKLDKRVLYFDTDSVIYLSKPADKSEYKVPIGRSLGQMTDELEEYGSGSFITEFVSGGPKNYAFKVYSTRDKKFHYSIKVRGITLNKVTAKRINFKCLKKMVQQFVSTNGMSDNINLVNDKIERKRQGHAVVTRSVQKKFRIVYDKRVLWKNFCTVPYGWHENTLVHIFSK